MDAGWGSDCPLCSRQLGGLGEEALPLRELAVGPAHGDHAAQEAHNAGRWYNCAAVIVHAKCLDRPGLDLETFVKTLEMHANDETPRVA
jgi:hypothetical protein